MPKAKLMLGIALRRELSGDQVVDRAFKDPDAFGYPMEELVTEFAFGSVWSRPELDRRSRSLVTIGVLAALNRQEALAAHIRIGMKNGLTQSEVQECLLQIAAYAGLPAGMDSLKVARLALNEPAT